MEDVRKFNIMKINEALISDKSVKTKKHRCRKNKIDACQKENLRQTWLQEEPNNKRPRRRCISAVVNINVKEVAAGLVFKYSAALRWSTLGGNLFVFVSGNEPSVHSEFMFTLKLCTNIPQSVIDCKQCVSALNRTGWHSVNCSCRPGRGVGGLKLPIFDAFLSKTS